MRPSEVQLSYGEFSVFIRDAELSPSEEEWLGAWGQWDLACSPMNDDERRFIRYGHWVAWMKLAQQRDSLREQTTRLRQQRDAFRAQSAELVDRLDRLGKKASRLEEQVERLAAFIMADVPGEPRESQGAVDTVIRSWGTLLRVVQCIYDETDNYADGAVDASRHDRLCCEISDSLRPFVRRQG